MTLFGPRERAAALSLAFLLVVMAVAAPEFYTFANLRDLLLNQLAVLLVAAGMTLIILTGQIDISVGSQFAVCAVVTGLAAKTGMPILVSALAAGLALGAINGVLVARLRLPAIVVTLATMVALRDGLRWLTEGAWVSGLPKSFQWFGLGQDVGQIVMLGGAAVVVVALGWAMSNVRALRTIHATGSDEESARLAGIRTRAVLFAVFAAGGALTGLAAYLNSIRFQEIQSNSGVGLELKAIAAVVVGGTAIGGGRGSMLGTVIGVALLGVIGTALTFLGASPAWEKAVQGGIILIAAMSEALTQRGARLARA